MSNNDTFLLIQSYYDAFNSKDMKKFFSLLSDDVIHDINQGRTETGKDLFKDFMKHMDEMYSETVHDLIILTSRDGRHASARFHISGNYIKTDHGLPEAKGQPYVINAGAFFIVENKKIIRVSNYYNLEEWIKQIAD